jgi:hypothetical protein
MADRGRWRLSPECLICSTPDRPRPADPGTNTCLRCFGRILGRLYDLEQWVPTLDPTPQVRGGSRRAPGFASRPPVNLDVVAALDDRTVPTEEDPNRAIVAGVHGIAAAVRYQLRIGCPCLPLSFFGELAWLRGHLVLVAGLDDIAEIDDDLRELHDQVRRLAGEQKPQSVATCVNTIDLGEHTEQCKGSVYPHDWVDVAGEVHRGVRCRDCARIYSGLDMVRLLGVKPTFPNQHKEKA